MKSRVVVLNNEIMPYRIPLFEAMAQHQDYHLVVLYSTQRSWERAWKVTPTAFRFAYEILRGFSISLPKPMHGEWRTIWINPTLFFRLIYHRPDVIIAYEYSLPSLTALLYAKLFRCRYLVWSEMTPFTERHLSWGQRVVRRLIRPRVDAAIGTSKAACQTFVEAQVPPMRVKLAMQTVKLAYFRDSSVEPHPHPPTILHVGYLNERKGVRHLLMTFEQVIHAMPEARLVLVGGGDLESELRQLAESLNISHSVDFLGFIEPSQMPTIYAESDVFVLASLEDTFAVVVIEALASGVAVICSPFAGVASHLEDGLNAFIVDPHQTEVLAQRILQLLQNKAQRRAFIAASQALVASCHPHLVAKQFAEAIALAQRL